MCADDQIGKETSGEDPFIPLDPEVRLKLDSCQRALEEMGRVVVAFSAGVDSTFLLALAVKALGPENVIAGMGISPSLAERERAMGRELARIIGAELVEITTGELSDPAYAGNPANRCYYCKSDLFCRLKGLAEERGFGAVLSGANADDTGDFRPGIRAGEELGVRSPLLETGLTKADIRAASKTLELPTWDKPAMACLASRVAYGEAITADKLSRIEQAEYVLRDLGFRECRVRDHGTVARIEVPAGEINRVVESREAIRESLESLGYTYVAVDLRGFRSGSMNEVLTVVQPDGEPD